MGRFSGRLCRASDISCGCGAAKFTKTGKIAQDSVCILSNTCLYNIFETYFSYWGCFLVVNLQICLGSLPRKLLRNYCRIGQFFREFVSKNPAKVDFFFCDLSEALLVGGGLLRESNHRGSLLRRGSDTYIHVVSNFQ